MLNKIPTEPEIFGSKVDPSATKKDQFKFPAKKLENFKDDYSEK